MARLFRKGSPSPFFNGYEAECPLGPGTATHRTLLTPVSPAQPTQPLWRLATGNKRARGLGELNKPEFAARADHLRRLTWKGKVRYGPAWQAIGLAV